MEPVLLALLFTALLAIIYIALFLLASKLVTDLKETIRLYNQLADTYRDLVDAQHSELDAKDEQIAGQRRLIEEYRQFLGPLEADWIDLVLPDTEPTSVEIPHTK